MSGRTVWSVRVLAALAIVATLAAILVQICIVRLPPHLSLSAEKVGDGYVVISATPGGLGWKSGIRPGDRLEEAVGGTLKEGTSGTLIVNPTEATLAGISPGARVAVRSDAGLVVEERAREIFWMLGILFALCAAVVLLIRAWDRASWALFVCLTGAGLVVALAPVSGTRGSFIWQSISAAAILLAAVGFALFFAVFPGRAVSHRSRERLMLLAPVVIGSAILGSLLWGLVSESGVYDHALVALGCFVALMALMAGSFAICTYRETVAKIRRVQFGLVVGILVVGLSPAALLTVLPLSIGISPQRLPIVTSVAAMAVVPTGLVYTVSRHQWPQFRVPGKLLVPLMIPYASFVIGCFIALMAGEYFSTHLTIDRTGVLVLGAIAAATACFGLGFRKVLTALQRSGDEKWEMTREFVRRREERIREDERRRLVSDLHDGPIQSLTAALLFLGAKPTAPPRAVQALERATRELRTMVRFGTLPEVSGNLINAVEGLCKSIESLSNIAVVCNIQGGDFLEALPPEKRGDLYRIVQEALTNVVRHSRAREVVVRLNGDAKSVALLVKDNGIGFDLVNLEGITSGHFGLAGIRSRVESMGGVYGIQSEPGAGTTITVSIPTV
jgi:signal transduction histidine kinase